MSIKELREKQARIATNARAKFDEITDDTPAERAAEIEREFDAMMAEHDSIGSKIERLEKLEAAERAANAGDPRRPNGADGEARGADEPERPSYRSVFAKIVCGVEVSDLEPSERAVLRQGVTRFEGRAQVAGTPASGGYTVPTELANEIIRSMLAWGPMYDPGVTREMVTSGGNPITFPTVNDTAVTAEPHTEAAPLTDDGGKDVTFGQKVLNAYAYDTEFVKWSWELEQDSIFSMESLLGDLLGERLGRIANLQLTVGTGSNTPQGIVGASTAGLTAASETAVTGDELIDLVHSVDPAYRSAPRARWMFNDTTLASIRKLKDGQGNYLWQEPNVRTGEPGTLLGYPYSVNQAMANMATSARPVIFGDFGKYIVRKVGTPVIGVLRERFWPELGIAGLIRFDGELGDNAAVKHLVMDDGT